MNGGKVKAVALYSGGLDSSLAILQMMKYGVGVEAVKFLTHFGCDAGDSSSCGFDPYPAAEQFGFEVKLAHLGQKFIDIVKNPRFGHGKNMNPCIDCRLVMLGEIKNYMETSGGDFVITGEVLGQRPMSQRKFTLDLIARECGLEGRLVRPLSGRLLASTVPEKEGLIEREWLLDIQGRSRKRQMKLAEEFGLKRYPNPAAGCLLTDIRYSDRLRDLLKYKPDIDFDDLNLLRVGRHFRLSADAKLIVGRDEDENDALDSLMRDGDCRLEAVDFGSPVGLVRGRYDDAVLQTAAAIVARYCDGKNEKILRVAYNGSSGDGSLQTAPAQDAFLNEIRI